MFLKKIKKGKGCKPYIPRPLIPTNRIIATKIKGTNASNVASVPEKFPAAITALTISKPTTPTTVATTTAVITFIWIHPRLILKIT